MIRVRRVVSVVRVGNGKVSDMSLKSSGLAFGCVLCLLSILCVTTLWAHMRVQKTMPEDGARLTSSPHRIQVWYTQLPDEAISQLLLEGVAGEISLGDTTVKKDKSLMAMVPSVLADGDYTVKWRTAGDDGHTQRGDFAFTVRSAN